jgi:DNA gyrase inhibitor GyrI
MLLDMRFDTTKLEDTPVLYTAIPGDPEEIHVAARRAWEELSGVVELDGRQTYGYWHPPELEYRACSSLAEGDVPAALGLQETVLPGGWYRRASLDGDDAYARIGPTFDELARDANVDRSRPFLELYRGHNEVDVLVPVEPN